MAGTAKAAKVISFKLQDGKTQEEAVEAMKGIMDYFAAQSGGQKATFMHDPESGSYYVFAMADSMETLKGEGKSMVTSGAGDRLFSVVDPPTFKALNCNILDI